MTHGMEDVGTLTQIQTLGDEVHNLRLALEKLSGGTNTVGNNFINWSSLECSYCKCKGHLIQGCQFPGGGKEGQPFPPKICHYCKAPGHVKHECPQLMRKGNDNAQQIMSTETSISQIQVNHSTSHQTEEEPDVSPFLAYTYFHKEDEDDDFSIHTETDDSKEEDWFYNQTMIEKFVKSNKNNTTDLMWGKDSSITHWTSNIMVNKTGLV